MISEGEEPENFFWVGIGGRKPYDKVRQAYSWNQIKSQSVSTPILHCSCSFKHFLIRFFLAGCQLHEVCEVVQMFQ